MQNWHKITLAIAALALAAILFRYDSYTAKGLVFTLDRWTGETRVCQIRGRCITAGTPRTVAGQ